MGSQPDPIPVAPAFAPSTDVPLAGQDAVDQLQRALEASPNAIDLIVAADPPKPVGRSWAFNWHTKRFVKPTGAQGPKVTTGAETLTQWIEKAIRTARGAHPVHPLTYGFVQPQGGLYGRSVGEVPPDLEQIIRDTLTFHWAISDVTDFAFSFEPDEEWMAVAFTVELSDATAIRLQNVRLAVSP